MFQSQLSPVAAPYSPRASYCSADFRHDSTTDLSHDLATAKAAGWPYYPSPLYLAMEEELNRRNGLELDHSGLWQV